MGWWERQMRQTDTRHTFRCSVVSSKIENYKNEYIIEKGGENICHK